MTLPTSAFPATDVAQPADAAIASLIAGMKWGGGAGTGVALTYSFPGAGAVFAGYNGAAYTNTHEDTSGYPFLLDATQQAGVRAALAAWAAVANVTFQEVPDTASNVGDMRFAWTSASRAIAGGNVASWGWAYNPDDHWPDAGDVWISTVGGALADSSWSPGSFNYEALIHEIGHALGLKHPFDPPTLMPAAYDNLQYTLMSYNEAPHSLFVKVTHPSANSVSAYWYYVSPDTPMLYDIAAMQALYGPNLTYRTGDDTYTFDPAAPFMRTIWDAGGNDTISVSNFDQPCTIDLEAGHCSKVTILADSTAGYSWSTPPPTPTYDGTDDLSIAFGCTIENAVGGQGSDTLVGNEVANRLSGGAGNDTLSGAGGIDTAVYASARASATIAATASGFAVSAPGEGSDSLDGIERLAFADQSVAIDLSGNAGMVAKLLGAVFGPTTVSNATYVGIGLKYADSAMTYDQLAQLAITVRLGAGATHKQVVDTLYANVVGAAPSPADEAHYVGLLDSNALSVSQLTVQAADFSLNAARIGLVGLTQSGLAFVPA